jgi:pimeloyl-ACP methyl ester carboxylesterase
MSVRYHEGPVPLAAAGEELYLPSGSGTLFGVLHRAATPAAATAVLLCPPLGWDEICSARARRAWAAGLAGAGFATLRFDLPGTGDSAGSTAALGGLTAWTEAIDTAARWLAAETRATRVVGVGLGAGGLLLWRALAAGAPVDDVVLWGVPARGRAAVRELDALGRMERASNGHIVDHGDHLGGGFAPGGFLIPGEAIDELRTVSLDAGDLPDPSGRRILLLGRDGVGIDDAFVAALAARDVEVTTEAGAGYGGMMVDPAFAKLPAASLAVVERWLAAPAPERDRPPATAVAAVPELRLDRFCEVPFEIAHGGMTLRGILTRPISEPAGICAILVGAGAIRRVGQGRMWTDAARAWAARGVPTLRLDFVGVGESDGPLSQAVASWHAFYTPESGRQFADAMDALEGAGVADRFLLVGLCSSAYWAFRAAVDDERVAAAVLLNPSTLDYEKAIAAVRESRRLGRELMSVAGLRKLLRWRLLAVRVQQLATVTAAGLHRTRRRLRHAVAPPPVDVIESLFDQLAAGGTNVLMLFGENEALPVELEEAGYLARLDRWPNVEIRMIPGGDHAMRPLGMQAEARAALDGALEAELRRLPGG